MRRALGKAVRNRFDEQLRRRLPQFERDADALVPQGWLVYRHKLRLDLTCFLVLAIDPKSDNFTIECAWSTTGSFPAHVGLSSPRDFPESGIKADPPRDGAMYFRLAWLYTTRDVWWELVPRDYIQASLDRFTDAVISGDQDELVNAMRDSPIEEAMSKVSATVDEAVQKIAQYAVPYFGQVAEQ